MKRKTYHVECAVCGWRSYRCSPESTCTCEDRRGCTGYNPNPGCKRYNVLERPCASCGAILIRPAVFYRTGGAQKLFSADEVNEIRAMYLEDEMSLSEIATVMFSQKSTIKAALLDVGVTLRPRGSHFGARRQPVVSWQMREMEFAYHFLKMDLDEVGQRFGLRGGTVREKFIKAGIPFRDPISAQEIKRARRYIRKDNLDLRGRTDENVRQILTALEQWNAPEGHKIELREIMARQELRRRQALHRHGLRMVDAICLHCYGFLIRISSGVYCGDCGRCAIPYRPQIDPVRHLADVVYQTLTRAA